MFCWFLRVYSPLFLSFFFFFNDTATTEIYTLSLHDALPISPGWRDPCRGPGCRPHRWSSSRSEEHTSELQSHSELVCRLLLEKKKKNSPFPSAQPQLALHRKFWLPAKNTKTDVTVENSPPINLFFFNDTATTEIYTLSYTTLFRSRLQGRSARGELPQSDPHHSGRAHGR